MALRLRLDKPWRPLTAEVVDRLPGQLGVYQVADAKGTIVYIGQAGARTPSACAASCSARRAERAAGHQFRVEVNQQYRTRWFELLMVHQADHGSLPADNAKNPPPRSAAEPVVKISREGGDALIPLATLPLTRTTTRTPMDFEPSAEQQMLIDQVRRYVREEIIPLEAKLDPDAAELDPADHARLVEKTKAMGLFGIDIPKEFGGPDIDIVTRVLLAIEMAQHRAGLYVPCYGTFGGAGLAQIFEANEDQKERYLYPTLRGEKKPFFGLTEPSGGSDPGARHPDQGRAQGQWLGAERRQDLHLRRRPRRSTASCSPAPTPPRAAPASPASSSTPTRRASTCAASCTRCARRTTPPSSSSRTAGCRTTRCWARSTRASPSPTTA